MSLGALANRTFRHWSLLPAVFLFAALTLYPLVNLVRMSVSTIEFTQGTEIWRFTPHANVVWERSTGFERIVSIFEGVEFQLTQKLAFDLSGQHFSVAGGAADHQVVFGLTLNLGKLE